MSKYDVITIGSATRDVYLESKALQSFDSDKFNTGEGICIPAGSKVAVDDIHFTTGGSAVNTAVTFGQQGLKTGIICKVGNDPRGHSVEELLEHTGIDTELMIFDESHLTAYSVVLHSPEGERSIFVYRGASSYMGPGEVDLEILKNTKWVFVTHLGGDAAELFEPLLKGAKENNVKVALNPGSTQLKMGEKLVPLLDYVDILFVNQEEAALLTGLDYKKETEIFDKLDEWVNGTVVMTKGPEGVIASDGKTRWEAGVVEEPVFKDRTGAGDAFASGFTTAIIQEKDVASALQLASTNAAGVLGEWGANRGLLIKDDSPEKFGKLKIKETNI